MLPIIESFGGSLTLLGLLGFIVNFSQETLLGFVGFKLSFQIFLGELVLSLLL